MQLWCSGWCQSVVTQPQPWYSSWCQCVVTQPKPWYSWWCQCVVTAPALVFLVVSVCCDTAPALVFLVVSVCCDKVQTKAEFLSNNWTRATPAYHRSRNNRQGNSRKNWVSDLSLELPAGPNMFRDDCTHVVHLIISTGCISNLSPDQATACPTYVETVVGRLVLATRRNTF